MQLYHHNKHKLVKKYFPPKDVLIIPKQFTFNTKTVQIRINYFRFFEKLVFNRNF